MGEMRAGHRWENNIKMGIYENKCKINTVSIYQRIETSWGDLFYVVKKPSVSTEDEKFLCLSSDACFFIKDSA